MEISKDKKVTFLSKRKLVNEECFHFIPRLSVEFWKGRTENGNMKTQPIKNLQIEKICFLTLFSTSRKISFLTL